MLCSTPITDFPITVRQLGDLPVYYMHGRKQPDFFVLYLGLVNYIKHVKAEVVCEGGASIVVIYPTPETHWYEEKDGKEVECTPTSDLPTEIELPMGWCLGVEAQKDSIRIIGVRMGAVDNNTSRDFPFTVEKV